MSTSQKFWNLLTDSEEMNDWKPWLNTKCDDSDTVSFINKELKRAIKIIYDENDTHPYAVWVKKFGDDPLYPEGTVEFLVVSYKDSSKALSVAKKLFSNWKNKDYLYIEMQTDVTALL
ncbi:hypothetical protein [Thiofilum flexile]|uniref:hypothetical protein n=1 Tax=Thiofilum flexile TaxID=125627 RepID=UPI0003618246|nr:hypothetical protein [Thiofilum flexile]